MDFSLHNLAIVEPDEAPALPPRRPGPGEIEAAVRTLIAATIRRARG